MWVERAYQCNKGGVEEVYAHCCGENGDGNGNGEALVTAAVDDAAMCEVDVATDVYGGGPGARP